jgi:pyruvate dehydrogenase E2 component (dihydrolipoamide acetyltransferase)
VNVSVNDIIVKAVGKALRIVPEVNASYNPANDSIDVHDNVDVSVAVATDGGLITPIVKAVDA